MQISLKSAVPTSAKSACFYSASNWRVAGNLFRNIQLSTIAEQIVVRALPFVSDFDDFSMFDPDRNDPLGEVIEGTSFARFA